MTADRAARRCERRAVDEGELEGRARRVPAQHADRGHPTVQLLARKDGNVTALLNVGDQAASRPFVEQRLPDRPAALVNGYGHDGQQFYVVARSVDRPPADRRQRRPAPLPGPAHPVPAARARRSRPGRRTVWAMFAISLLSVGMAARGRRAAGPAGGRAGVARAGRRRSTPALLISVRASLGDALAFSLALWGVVLWRRHLGWAVLLFALAALTRETTLVVAGRLLPASGTRRQRAGLLIPFAVYGAWSLDRQPARPRPRLEGVDQPGGRRPAPVRPAVPGLARPRARAAPPCCWPSCSRSRRCCRPGCSGADCPRWPSGWWPTPCLVMHRRRRAWPRTSSELRPVSMPLAGVGLALVAWVAIRDDGCSKVAGDG